MKVRSVVQCDVCVRVCRVVWCGVVVWAAGSFLFLWCSFFEGALLLLVVVFVVVVVAAAAAAVVLSFCVKLCPCTHAVSLSLGRKTNAPDYSSRRVLCGNQLIPAVMYAYLSPTS